MLDIEEWDEEECDSVEDSIQMIVKVYDLGPDEVVSAIRREANIREYNESNTKEGRPSKQEEYFQRFKKIVEADYERNAKLNELEELRDEMERELSRATRYKVRQNINEQYQIYIKMPFHSMKRKDLDELLFLESRKE